MASGTLPPIEVRLPGSVRYAVRFGPLESLAPALRESGLRPSRCLVVTDGHVDRLHADRLVGTLHADGWEVRKVVVPSGEASKASSHLDAVYDRALEWPVDRSTPVLAFGGGVVGDLAGFAAATLLRGLPLVHVPTTLLAQVDSAVGGKTGINHPAGKNLIGAFHQPRLVWSDPGLLDTLPDREWHGGAAEVVKHALIAGDPLLGRLEDHLEAFLHRDPGIVGPVIRDAVAVKVGIVEADEKEAGVRAYLNFGHTFAHALERVLGYGTIIHGEAVAVGMRAALFLSRTRHASLPFDRALRLVEAIPVPVLPADLDLDRLADAMRTDKKARGATLRFVVLDDLGTPRLVDDVEPDAIRDAWAFALGVGN